METIAREHTAIRTTTNNNLWNRLLVYGEENRFGIICVTLLIVGCLGGLTMMYGAAQYTSTLIAVVIPTMLTLSLLLAVAPMRFIFLAFALAIITDLIVFLALIL